MIISCCVEPFPETVGEDQIQGVIRHILDERGGLLAARHVLEEIQQLVERDGRLGVAGEAGVSGLKLSKLGGCEGEES